MPAIAGPLGFLSEASCRTYAVPLRPVFLHVQIDLQINSATTATFAVGRKTTGEPGVSGCHDTYSWAPALIATSGGRSSKIIHFDRHLAEDQYVRITLCSNTGLCGASCGSDAVEVNKLVHFYIDKFDYALQLDGVEKGDAGAGDVKVGCIGSAVGACCSTTGDDATLTDHTLVEGPIPWGVEVRVGPIGSSSLFSLA